MSNLIQSTTELALYIVRAYVRPGDTVIDATCGNGRDTVRLAQMRPGRLLAFDVQESAVRATRQLLTEEGFARELNDGRYEVIRLGHEHMKEFFRTRAAQAKPDSPAPEGFASAIVFNLGYLPGGDKALTTQEETTLAAVGDSLALLKAGGLISVTMYSGHPAGKKEKQALLEFSESLDSSVWHVSYVSMHNQRNDPPEILLLTRKR